MALPRMNPPNTSYIITRRVDRNESRLDSSPAVTDIERYCIAHAADKSHILVHGVVAYPSFHRLVVTDVRGMISNFARDLHRSSANALNDLQDRHGKVWDDGRTSMVVIPTDEDLIDQIAKLATMPVADGLAEDPDQWSGVVLWKPGSSVVVNRPSVYFDPRGRAPESIELRIAPPPKVSKKDWRKSVHDAVATRVRELRAELRAAGKKVSAAAATAQGFSARAWERIKESVCAVAVSKEEEIVKACEEKYREFLRAYRRSLLAWKQKNREVPFPYGTWWMRVHHGAAVESP